MHTIRYVPVGPFTLNPVDLFAKEPTERPVPLANMETYKAPATYSLKTSREVMQNAASDIRRLTALADVTAHHAAENPANKTIANRLESLAQKCRGPALTREELFDLRCGIYKCEQDIMALRKECLKDAFEASPKEVRNKIQMLMVLQTILDGDFDSARKMLGEPQHEHVTKGESEMLRTLDDGLLRTFTGMGICVSSTMGERREQEDAINLRKMDLLAAKASAAAEFLQLGKQEREAKDGDSRFGLHRAGQAKIAALKHINAELENLEVESWQVNRQVFSGNRYYGLVPDFLPLMEGLSSLAHESGLNILSRTRLENQVLESLYTEPLQKLVDLGLIERVPSSQITSKPKPGLVNRANVTHVDGAYYRISISGLRMLKEVIPPRAKVQPKPPVMTAKDDEDFAFDIEFY